ncbi:IS66 family insertion sequence element accessory protein TnpA [Xenorhabdus vietnamensis]|uniref:IS66 family insertion sequence element accessory protein TnpA n=1 Tax=Xenorhabdus vietnamensis TaxID=351656 RepID=UPI003BB5A89F
MEKSRLSQSRFTQAEWLDIFEQQKKSDLTVHQFCQKIGISMTQFYHHRRRDSHPQEKRSGPANGIRLRK